MTRLLLAAAFASVLIAPGVAAAACPPPPGLAHAPVETPPPGEIVDKPADFHVLSLAWAPRWRQTQGTSLSAPSLQCDDPDLGFFLHGLWPNARQAPHPRYCRPVGTIDPATVRRMYRRSPGAAFLQHEWQTHGACGWATPKAYFRDAARLYDRIVPPNLEAIAPADFTAGAVRRAFVAANPRLAADQIILLKDADGRFREALICHDLKFRPVACPGGAGPPDETPLILLRRGEAGGARAADGR